MKQKTQLATIALTATLSIAGIESSALDGERSTRARIEAVRTAVSDGTLVVQDISAAPLDDDWKKAFSKWMKSKEPLPS